ncbi:hypothetical protein [Clostridium sp. CF012]|uniref:hypothetical protein n=1 Tax=Clostridium sp. CF012 TaxID=2843319 RepID=UPI001C0CCACF|nr:hypothetical protein [Clostridium sp. CF012]MBU3142783.1 hypothetical protein [Clostridium sp. CF012]
MDKYFKTQNSYYIWMAFYMVIVPFFTISSVFLLKNISIVIFVLTFFLTLSYSFFLAKKEINKKSLYMQNVLSILGSMALGFIGSFIMTKIPILFWIWLIYVIIMDSYNFTNIGKKTKAAKLIKNPEMVSRLSINLPIPFYENLVPVIGVGDLSYFILIVITTAKLCENQFFWYTGIAIILGQIVNAIIFLSCHKKRWYKGIPATVFPGVFSLLMILYFNL